MAENDNQDDLAAAWAAALDGQGADAKAGGGNADDKLAAEWAAALASDEQGAVQQEKAGL